MNKTHWRQFLEEHFVPLIDVGSFLEFHYADRLDIFPDKTEAFMWQADNLTLQELMRMADESAAWN